MSEHKRSPYDPSQQRPEPLSPRFLVYARLFLHCPRFSCDALLIAGDWFAQAGAELRMLGHDSQAQQAKQIANALRAEAPRRLRPRACPATLASLDRVA